MRPARKSHRLRPAGAVLIVTLVCLAVVMALLGSMLLALLRTGRQLHVERDLRQCELLLQAGLERAAYRLATRPDYRGETWTLGEDEIISAGKGQVTITREAGELGESRQLSVVAEYPLGTDSSIRRSRTISNPLKRSTTEE